MIIGIDPGLKGAIALYDDLGVAYGEKKLLSIIDMPVEAKATKGNRIDARSLLETISAINEGIETYGKHTAVIERVNAMPKQGVTSSFNFGEGYGVLRCAVSTTTWPIVYVSPNKWKKDLDLTGKDKSYSITKAKELMPEAARFLTLKGHDGRAEAALIAYWYGNK